VLIFAQSHLTGFSLDRVNAVEPHAYLKAILRAINNVHKQSQIDDLLPWNYAKHV